MEELRTEHQPFSQTFLWHGGAATRTLPVPGSVLQESRSALWPALGRERCSEPRNFCTGVVGTLGKGWARAAPHGLPCARAVAVPQGCMRPGHRLLLAPRYVPCGSVPHGPALSSAQAHAWWPRCRGDEREAGQLCAGLGAELHAALAELRSVIWKMCVLPVPEGAAHRRLWCT